MQTKAPRDSATCLWLQWVNGGDGTQTSSSWGQSSSYDPGWPIPRNFSSSRWVSWALLFLPPPLPSLVSFLWKPRGIKCANKFSAAQKWEEDVKMCLAESGLLMLRWDSRTLHRKGSSGWAKIYVDEAFWFCQLSGWNENIPWGKDTSPKLPSHSNFLCRTDPHPGL